MDGRRQVPQARPWPAPEVSLAEAREKADAVRRLFLNGIDPREDRRAKQAEAAIAAAN